MKVVINACHGGFGLSKEAMIKWCEQSGLNPGVWKDNFGYFEKGDIGDWEIPRDNEYLVTLVEEMGEKADGRHASLKVIEIPDDVDWYVEEYDGYEWVAERHRTWK